MLSVNINITGNHKFKSNLLEIEYKILNIHKILKFYLKTLMYVTDSLKHVISSDSQFISLSKRPL